MKSKNKKVDREEKEELKTYDIKITSRKGKLYYNIVRRNINELVCQNVGVRYISQLEVLR